MEFVLFEGVPTMYMFLLNHPQLEAYDLSSLRCCTVGGQTMPVAKMEEVEEKVGCPLIELWGMTELNKTILNFNRYARVIHLKRRKKQLSALVVVTAAGDVTTRRSCGYAICRWLAGASTWSSNAGGSVARGVTACM